MSPSVAKQPGKMKEVLYLGGALLILFGLMAALSVVAGVDWAVDPRPRYNSPEALVGEEFPPIPIDEQQDFTVGGDTVVYVFATWCGPCRRGLPSTRQWVEDEGLTLVMVNIDDPSSQRQGAIADFALQTGTMDIAVAAPEPSEVYRLGVSSVPTVFGIDSNGIVRYASSGVPNRNEVLRSLGRL